MASDSGDRCLISQDAGTPLFGSNSQFQLINSRIQGGLLLTLNHSGGVELKPSRLFPASLGTMGHVAAVLRAGALHYYIDGVPASPPIPFAQTLNDSSEPVRIGNRGDQDEWFHGTLDELRIWKRGLSEAEVSALFFSESPQWLSFNQQPQGGVFAAGQTVNLNVEASGVGTLAFQWLRDGVAVPGATNATLTLADAHPRQSGQYTVRVSNALRSLTSEPAEIRIDPTYTFTRTSSGSIATDVSNAQEGQWVDYDHDGDLDLFLVSYNQQKPAVSERR